MFKIIREKDWVVSRWSGGITNQLYIYPEDSDYQKRDFKFRLSIATTENESSVFTKLDKTWRVISILDGTMKLEHKNRYTVALNKYEIDRFSGEWDSFSIGRVTDFNLMIKDGEGDFFFKEARENIAMVLDNKECFNFVYCIDGSIKTEDKELFKGELLVTDKKKIELNLSFGSKIFYGYIKN